MEIQRDYLPQGVTENEFLDRLNPEELEEIQKDIAYTMIHRKTFDDAKVLKMADYHRCRRTRRRVSEKNDYYPSRCYNRGESNECTKYHRSVLEAKLYLGHNLLCSIATETIQNSEEYISQSEAKVKQDCESKAFIRLAEKIKKRCPRLPVNITADGKIKVTKFAWITNIEITKGDARKIVRAGRNRWKIENQGFNRQKHWQGNIEHAYSFHEQAQKNHYLMER